MGNLQLSMVTDERDSLRNIVNELKKSNSGVAGNQEASGTGVVIQVWEFFPLLAQI